MRVFVCEFAETHHNIFSTVYTLARHIWGGKVFGVVTSEVYRRLRAPIKGVVFGLDKSAYKGKGVKDKVTTLIADFRDSYAIYEFVKTILSPSPGDVFIFTTFEPWLSRHFGALIALYRYLHKVGAKVIVGVHNSFWFYYPENVTSEEKELVENHISGWKWHVKARYHLSKRLVDPSYFNAVFTLGEIKVPEHIKRVRLLDRFYEPKYIQIPKFDTFTIAIPGSVDASRRDYKVVAEAVRALPFDVRVILLGRLIDEWVLALFPRRVELLYFREFVPEDKYVELLAKSHVAIAPVKDKFYGTFSVTGAVGDAVMVGIPVLCPKFYRDQIVFNYSGAEGLRHLLVELRNGGIEVHSKYSSWSLGSLVEKLAWLVGEGR